jgi:hypothetical protein
VANTLSVGKTAIIGFLGQFLYERAFSTLHPWLEKRLGELTQFKTGL